MKFIVSSIITGAPLKPIRGTLPFKACLVIVIASKTYFNSFLTSQFLFNLSKSAGTTNGAGNDGP